MSEKLKTLKDLQKEKVDLWSAGQVGSTDKPLSIDYKIWESTLRQLIINWIKALREGYNSKEEHPDLTKILGKCFRKDDTTRFDDWRTRLVEKEEILIYIFNITEKELGLK